MDFPLQGNFLATAKNQTAPVRGVPALYILFSHAFLQAGAVFFITSSLTLSMIELVAHIFIDYQKSAQRITFAEDQVFHFACKLFYVGLLFARAWGAALTLP